MLFVMGLARLGGLVKYIHYPVTMGFTCGIAVLIFSTQIKDFFGLRVDKLPPDFVDKVKVLLENLDKIDWRTVGLTVASVLIIKAWPARLNRRVPGSIVA
jgi:SulP family sulfate permease